MIEINIENKSMKNGGSNVLYSDVNINIKNGIHILKGENGSGKTTLLNIIYKLDTDYKGYIKINGEDISKIKNSILRNDYITYVEQGFGLFENLTPKENIDLLILDPQISKLNKIIEILNCEEVINSNREMKRFSEGQRQKIKLLIGLSSRTPILLLDEPNNNLDLDTVNKLAKYLEEEKRILIITSHTFEEYLSKENINIIEIKGNKILQENKKDNEDLIKDSKKEEASEYFMKDENNKSKKINKKILKKLNKTTLKKRIFIMAIIFFMVILVSNSLLKILTTYATSFEDQTMYLSDDSLIVTAPSASYLTYNYGTKDSFEKTPYYFTNEDYKKLKSNDKVEYVYPIYSWFNGYIGRREYDYEIDLKSFDYEFAKEKYNIEIGEDMINDMVESDVESRRCMSPKRVSQNYGYGCPGEIVYGEFPDDNSNEVLLNESAAVYFASEKKLNNVNDIIGKEITINAYNLLSEYGKVEEPIKQEYSWTVSGIIDNDESIITIIYPYDKDSYIVKRNSLWINFDSNFEQQLTSISNTYEKSGVKPPTMEEMMPLEWNSFPAFFIEVGSKSDVKELSEEIHEYNPYIDIDSKYDRENSNNMKAIKNYLKEELIQLVILLLIFLMLIIMLIKYYNATLLENIKKFEFFAFEDEEISKYIISNNKSLVVDLFFEIILIFIITSIIGGFYIITFAVFTILLVTILILVIITLKISKIKRGVK